MKIKILGTRGEIKPSAPYHSKQSGLLVDKKILFDLGEEEFLKYRPKYIFLTHLHKDHAFFMRPDSPSVRQKIFAPEKDEKADIQIIKTKKKINSYNIQPIPTIHSHKKKSQAYLIQKGRQSVLYTGDMLWIKKTYHHYLKNLDLVITEASFIKKGGMVRRDRATGKPYGHQGVPNLMSFFSQFTKNILFIHFGSWFYNDISESRKKLIKMGQEHGLNVFVGYDGMELDINSLS
jgi:ribonuclease BN (tRNA processing enzyme)